MPRPSFSRESLRPADVVLVKASSMVGLSAVAAALDDKEVRQA